MSGIDLHSLSMALGFFLGALLRLRQLCSQAASEVLSDNYWKRLIICLTQLNNVRNTFTAKDLDALCFSAH